MGTAELIHWISAYGTTISTVLLESSCCLFTTPHIAGAIGYRRYAGVLVVLGDPVCAPADMPVFLDAFRHFAAEQKASIVYAVASSALADYAQAQGWSTVAFGVGYWADAPAYKQQTQLGRRLRQKLARAQREGLQVHAYNGNDAALEEELETFAQKWVETRHGFQVCISSPNLFAARDMGHLFYALHAGKPVAVLNAVRAESIQGYIFTHFMTLAGAPAGTSELLVVEAITALANAGAQTVGLGALSSAHLGAITGLSKPTQWLARRVFNASARVFGFEGKLQFWNKFPCSRVQDLYLICDPPCFGWRQIYALMRTFNVGFC